MEQMTEEQIIQTLKEIVVNIASTKTRGESDKTISKRVRYTQALMIVIELLESENGTNDI